MSTSNRRRSSRKRSSPNFFSQLNDSSNTIHNEPPQRKKAKKPDFDTVKKVNPTKDEAIEKDENNSGETVPIVRPPASSDKINASLGPRKLFRDVMDDAALVKVSEAALQAGNRKSKQFVQHLLNKVVDSCNKEFLKCSKTIRPVSKDGFEGKELTVEDLEEMNPELLKFIDFCSKKNIIINPFVQVYLVEMREEGSNRKCTMKCHRDRPRARFHKGREPHLRMGCSRISQPGEEDIDKTFKFERLIEGTTDEFDIVSVEIEDGDVLFLGAYASGKYSSIHHQPSIYHKNSVSLMADIIFPEGSPFINYTIPQFVEYLIRHGIFARKSSINVKYDAKKKAAPKKKVVASDSEEEEFDENLLDDSEEEDDDF